MSERAAGGQAVVRTLRLRTSLRQFASTVCVLGDQLYTLKHQFALTVRLPFELLFAGCAGG